MRHLVLCAVLAIGATRAGAQRVPGRDLLMYPLGLIAEPAALGTSAASGLWNPATALLDSATRGRIAAAALSAPIDLALAGQVVHAAFDFRSIGTVSLGVVRASITELPHTETDPQSIGPDIPYSTFVLSAGVARRLRPQLSAGIALRAHSGHVASQRASTFVSDVGVVAEHLTQFDVRLAASTFLWSPGDDNSASVSAAADARVWQRDSNAVRAGWSYVRTGDISVEQYPYLDVRISQFAIRGGPVRLTSFGATTVRMRLGLAFQHRSYSVGVAREDSANGLSPTYQLAVTNVFR